MDRHNEVPQKSSMTLSFYNIYFVRRHLVVRREELRRGEENEIACLPCSANWNCELDEPSPLSSVLLAMFATLATIYNCGRSRTSLLLYGLH